MVGRLGRTGHSFCALDRRRVTRRICAALLPTFKCGSKRSRKRESGARGVEAKARESPDERRALLTPSWQGKAVELTSVKKARHFQSVRICQTHKGKIGRPNIVKMSHDWSAEAVGRTARSKGKMAVLLAAAGRSGCSSCMTHAPRLDWMVWLRLSSLASRPMQANDSSACSSVAAYCPSRLDAANIVAAEPRGRGRPGDIDALL